jgi:O-succinylbenzoate synthase
MNIVSIDISTFSIPFRADFISSKGSLHRRDLVIVSIHASHGRTGLGEIAPLQPFSRESTDEALFRAHATARRLIGLDIPAGHAELFPNLDSWLPGREIPPSVFFGFETALADLASQAAGIPLARWLCEESGDRVPLNAILPAEDEGLEKRLREKWERGYRTFKFKIGRDRPEDDATRIAAAREILGPSAKFRLDANRAWDFDRAVSTLLLLEPLGIEYIEEPLAEPDLSRSTDLFDATGIHIALDETVQNPKLYDALLSTRAVSAVILKPTIIGGLHRTLSRSEGAVSAGKQAVISSLFESGIGISAGLHLAAALGPGVPACGLDTLDHLETSLIHESLEVRDGSIHLPDRTGLGVTLSTGGTEG